MINIIQKLNQIYKHLSILIDLLHKNVQYIDTPKIEYVDTGISFTFTNLAKNDRIRVNIVLEKFSESSKELGMNNRILIIENDKSDSLIYFFEVNYEL